jgi:glycosyltransferase involved in cell wall biosynthesis
MKVLHVAAGFPSDDKPFLQPFIKSQIESIRNEGVEIDIYNIKGFKSAYYYIKSIWDIRKVVSENKYDIIHAHYSYCGLSVYLAKLKKPIVLSLMGSDLFGDRNLKGQLTLRGKIDRALTTFISKRVDHLIVKSKKMESSMNVITPVSIIPNGVDLNFFKPKEKSLVRKTLKIKEDDFVVLFLGNSQSSVKNFQLAKNSVELFKKEIEKNNIYLLNPFGINQDLVVDYMNASDVLLLTSFYEGSPNVIKESMACNLPIISTDVGDVKELIYDTCNCFVVGFSEKEISKRLTVIYQTKERSNGREKVTIISNEIIARKIKNIYDQLIGG